MRACTNPEWALLITNAGGLPSCPYPNGRPWCGNHRSHCTVLPGSWTSRSAGSAGAYSGLIAATFARNNDADPLLPTRSANTVAGILGVTTSNPRTSFSNASNEDPAGLRSYFGAVSAANARSTVPRETPSCFANSRLEIFSFAKRWRIVTQSSKIDHLQ